MSKQPYLISTAIPYANGAPHIGHAYERIATDVLARFKRLDGADVLFITGMDEHGQKMQQTAARENLTPQELADRTAAQFEAMGAQLRRQNADIQLHAWDNFKPFRRHDRSGHMLPFVEALGVAIIAADGIQSTLRHGKRPAVGRLTHDAKACPAVRQK